MSITNSGDPLCNGKVPRYGTGEPAVAFDPTHVPEALREPPQWVAWRYEERNSKPTKVPVNPHTGKRASSTNPLTWGTFDEAVATWRASDRYAGVGFVFSADDPFTGVDLDGCIDESGNIVASAREIIESLSSYTEVSPSARGVKVFITGRKPDGAGCKSKAFEGFKETEVYDKERFFTLTGHHLASTPADIEERQVELEALCARLWPKKRSRQPAVPVPGGFDGDDEALIEQAGAAKNGDRFKRLWAGDTSMHGDDHSASDQALCNLLAFWTARDADRMDRLFRRSGLFREKWDERRGARTYGQMTIERAITDCTEVYSPGCGRGRPGGSVPAMNGTAEIIDEDGQAIALGQRDPATGRLVLSPRRTLPTAEAYAREFHQHAEGRTLHGYAGLLLEWRGNRYCQVKDEAVKHRLQPWLHAALRYVVNRRSGEMELVDFESNPTTVKQALDTIRAFTHLPATTVAPSWLDERNGRPPALELLPCRSANLHIPTGRVLAPTPALFTINALDFDYDPDPEPPERWIKFLEQLWGDDLESVELLQEWLGYCLTADTSQQKMLLLVGPRRSGKGTIGRVLTRLVGAANVVGPTTGSLAGNFALQPLIDKSLAIVSDARFTGDSVGTVVERLLCISGEDTLTVDRKFLGSVSMKLPTRFVFLTNELPRLNDASTALAGRFLVLRLMHSFYGQEDPILTDQLLAELPGILLWAIEGWKRLRQRGRFVQPASAEEAIRDLEDLASPVSAFVRERCVVGPGHRAWIDDLYAAWKAWCEQDGRTVVTHKQTFGRDLAAAVPGILRRRGTGMASFYDGIGLTGDPP
ncbi:MAG TPA: phage/plasmid primase, P4 family [Phycisphaerales bacterium]|nr:phage/plasmid primase, P4 family [Phycisphaerales bacterium]